MDTQMINFVIPKTLLGDVDRAAKETARSRSEFLREAIRQYLEEKEEKEQLFRAVLRSANRNNLAENEALELAQEAKQWARRRSK